MYFHDIIKSIYLPVKLFVKKMWINDYFKIKINYQLILRSGSYLIIRCLLNHHLCKNILNILCMKHYI